MWVPPLAAQTIVNFNLYQINQSSLKVNEVQHQMRSFGSAHSSWCIVATLTCSRRVICALLSSIFGRMYSFEKLSMFNRGFYRSGKSPQSCGEDPAMAARTVALGKPASTPLMVGAGDR